MPSGRPPAPPVPDPAAPAAPPELPPDPEAPAEPAAPLPEVPPLPALASWPVPPPVPPPPTLETQMCSAGSQWPPGSHAPPAVQEQPRAPTEHLLASLWPPDELLDPPQAPASSTVPNKIRVERRIIHVSSQTGCQQTPAYASYLSRAGVASACGHSRAAQRLRSAQASQAGPLCFRARDSLRIRTALHESTSPTGYCAST